MLVEAALREAAPYGNGLDALQHALTLLDGALGAHLERVNAHLNALREVGLAPGMVVTPSEVEDLARQDRMCAQGESVRGLGEQMWERVEASRRVRRGVPLDTLRRRFQLNEFEADCLLAAAAPDVERKYERIYGYLNDDLTRPFPSVGLLLKLLVPVDRTPAAFRWRLTEAGPLFRLGLLEWADGDPRSSGISALSACVRASAAVTRALLEEPFGDTHLESWSASSSESNGASAVWAEQRLDEPFLSLLDAHRSNEPRRAMVVRLVGKPRSGRRYAVAAACAKRGLTALPPLDAARLIGLDGAPGLLRRLARDAALLDTPLVVTHAGALGADAPASAASLFALENAVADFGILLCLACEQPEFLARRFAGNARGQLRFVEPNGDQRIHNWRRLLSTYTALESHQIHALAERVGSTFRLNAGQSWEVLSDTLCDGVDSSRHDFGLQLERAVASYASPSLGARGQRVRSPHRLQDLVLPPAKLDLVRDVVRRVQHRRKVFERWGFERSLNRGRGLNALFSGPPGTGKSMAAEVIANELGVELYRVDLAAVVSKYIGETEKNLAHVFEGARRADAILLFDEADALFGKRSEVQDAHDRYANIEVNYLLAAMENFDGVCILATNFRQNIDPAFFRRIQVAVDFPLPGAEERRHIWERLLTGGIPLAEDVDLDILAARFDIAGGSIVNISLTAAFLAADAGAPVSMEILAAAARRELDKLGRREVRSDGEWPTARESRSAKSA